MSDFQDTIRILIASDIHAGYGEGKKIIDEDSFIGLEETLKHATTQNVDFILLGGDLFHESVPSRYTEHKVIGLLRQYCFNNREVAIEMVSDPQEVFENNQFKLVNYEDPNINVGMPIFSIHGNHDDFSGKGLMALDILHDTGLVNLFGKFNSVDNIVVKPILLRKGDAKVALYGIGSQRDDRLQRAFHAGKVKFCFPEDVDSWFNILVVHQNRPPRSLTRTTGSFLPLSVLPSQMNLIIWGHEHKCEIEPQFFPKGAGDENDGFFIIQPGSTVATSISVDETSAKHVAVVEIKGLTFKTFPIPLQRTRQIIVEDLDLAKIQPQPRIVKLKARTKDMEPVNCRVIGHKYDGKVANPADIISTKRVRPDDENHKEKGVRKVNARDGTTVHDLLKQSFTDNDIESGLGVLSLPAMQQYVDLSTKVNESKKKKLEMLEESLNSQIRGYKDKIASMPLRSDTNQAEIDHIRLNVNKFISQIKDYNRSGSAAELILSGTGVKKELDDVENRENSIPGVLNDED
uniref:Mre11 DNA-binding domain-containing protein n=1 Tax=Panagrolaimus sp. ES5 TaxID=591445 RepID=A0AC34FZ53_9BILA